MKKFVVLCLILGSLFAFSQTNKNEESKVRKQFLAKVSEKELSLKGWNFFIRTDKTERGGKTEAKVEFSNNDLKISGVLASIDGRRGPVGFANIKVNKSLDLSPYKGLSFAVEGSPGLVFSFIAQDNIAVKNPFSTNYRQEFSVNRNNQVHINFSSLQATQRGSQVKDVKSIDLSRIQTIGFQITRSSQQPEIRKQKQTPFYLTIKGPIKLWKDSAKD